MHYSRAPDLRFHMSRHDFELSTFIPHFTSTRNVQLYSCTIVSSVLEKKNRFHCCHKLHVGDLLTMHGHIFAGWERSNRNQRSTKFLYAV